MNVQKLINSPFALRLVFFLGRVLPLRVGYALADFVARRLAARRPGRRESPLVRAVRANQWVVRGGGTGESTLASVLAHEQSQGEPGQQPNLDAAERCTHQMYSSRCTHLWDAFVYETLRSTAHSLFDLYHYLPRLGVAERLFVLHPVVEQLVQRREFEPRGLVVVGIHLSNFDLALQWIFRLGLPGMILTIPESGLDERTRSGQSRRLEFELRRKTGMNLIPTSVTALHQAVRYLKQGGVVLTGIDRPVEASLFPRFFGRPAALPSHHVYLALKAQVPIQMIAVRREADGRYHFLASDLIEMEPYPDRDEELRRNTEKVLEVAETWIRPNPEQWGISLPVWPEALEITRSQDL